jgi:hypothetical protein
MYRTDACLYSHLRTAERLLDELICMFSLRKEHKVKVKARSKVVFMPN